MDPKHVIEQGYDRIGTRYRDSEDEEPSSVRAWFLGQVLARLFDGAEVLELGCGPGTAAEALSQRRHYLGVDLSERQLAIARQRVPAAIFKKADFTRLQLDDGSFDAVVAFYVFGHVPLNEQAPTFASVMRWLRPEGRFMLSLGCGGGEGVEEDFLGVPMFHASFDRAMNERNLVRAGFELELSELREEFSREFGCERFQWVIARKPER